ncbi:MAG: hypothetical protein ACOYT4_05180 [Nanoarchaeota archaeon]
MKPILLCHKKGISEIMAYVFLVVIALSISLLVYSWLKFYSNSANDLKECPEDLSLIINNYTCNSGVLILTVQNKGLFTISGYTLRGSNDENSKIGTCLLKNSSMGGAGETWFGVNGFKPSESPKTFSYDLPATDECLNLKFIELQPFTEEIIGGESRKIFCERIIRRDIICG